MQLVETTNGFFFILSTDKPLSTHVLRFYICNLWIQQLLKQIFSQKKNTKTNYSKVVLLYKQLFTYIALISFKPKPLPVIQKNTTKAKKIFHRTHLKQWIWRKIYLKM